MLLTHHISALILRAVNVVISACGRLRKATPVRRHDWEVKLSEIVATAVLAVKYESA
jgi:hypothetical protein